jgi:integrator complex subunit 4
MGDPDLLSSAHSAAAASSTRKHSVPIDEHSSDRSPSITKRPRVAAEPPLPSGSAPYPEAEVRSLVMMAGGIYPLARAEAIRGLAAVLEKVDTSCGVGAGLVECCYGCAVELMRDEDEGVRLAVVRLVRCCHFVGTLL